MKALDKKLWIELAARYPDGIKIFQEWFENYKERVNWQKLFGEVITPHYVHKGPDFEELPEALQLGIWQEFTRGMNHQPKLDWNAAIQDFIKDLHAEAND